MNKYESKQIEHVKNNELEYIQFKILNKYNVKHCITLRHGGISTGEHESLNFRTRGTDSLENVLKNLSIITKELNFSKVYKANQNHTDKVITIDGNNKHKYEFEKLNKEEIDGYIVSEKNIATLVTTADCNPIIIFDPKNRVVSNIHAGWKGVINRVYINAINKMEEEYNSCPNDLIVCIGPSIRKCCFTSEEEKFKEEFTSVFKYENEYFQQEKESNKFHIDLVKILKIELKKAGILEDNIYVADICTRCNTQDFFSYRYSCQNNFKDYGTMATIVELI